VAQLKQRDPITLFEQQLRAKGVLEDADVQKMESTIAGEIAEAVTFAEEGPLELLENLEKDVYTE
jgi:TPP-dependent pyruvate/acetoin dehydrogenase alpha subunit